MPVGAGRVSPAWSIGGRLPGGVSARFNVRRNETIDTSQR
jgi:hypothetical protein